jgi:hypothetical protein
VAASNYSVNIKLNTTAAKNDLQKLEARINKLRKNLNSPLKIDTRVSKINKEIAKSKEAQRVSMIETRRMGDIVQRAADKGLKVDKARAAIKRAGVLDQKNLLKSSEAQRKIALDELKIQTDITEQVAKRSQLIASGKFAGGRNFGQIGGSIGPALPPSAGGAAGGGRRGFDFQSALISGGFPLLFGQGPFVGAAGALGGGIGGMFGQMGGFAGGIAATTAATTIQTFTIEVGKLGQALDPVTKNVEALTAALGVTGTEFEKQIATLKKLGDDEAAFEAARQKMINLVGSNGVDALTKFGQGMTELGNNFAKIMTLMRTSFALFVQNSGIGKVVTSTLERATLLKQAEVQGQNLDTPEGRELQTLLKTRKLTEQFGGLNPERRRELILNLTNQETGTGFGGQIHDRDVQKAREIVNDLIVKQQTIVNTKNAEKEADKMIETIQKSRVKNLDKEIEILERSFTMTSEQFEIEKQIAEMKEQGEIKDEDEIRRKLQKIQLLEKERKLAEETAAAFERMSQTIATDISQGIQGMIRGTSTLNDMLNNVLNKLIDAAFNMAFFGNPQGTLGGGGLFGSIFGGLGGLFGGGGGGTTDVFAGFNRGPASGVTMDSFANGGRPPVGRASVVGERGPELFVPNRAGTIIPNHALGGSTNVVVNVDASGSNVEGDEEEGRQLGIALSAAIESELIKQKRPGGLLA